jgi:hypothetical protein
MDFFSPREGFLYRDCRAASTILHDFSADNLATGKKIALQEGNFLYFSDLIDL